MNPIHVLAFAADPLSAPPHGFARRLRVDDEVRQIREKLRAAAFRDLVTFDVRWAARTDDLLQALNETHPEVVHFSGHGGKDGLWLVGKDGKPHGVNGDALARLFTVFPADIRVVVLSACFTLPQAQSIADAVGCAIGTRGEISDAAAITFAASFYRAIAFGHSVQVAFDQARTALVLDHHDDRECPELVVRPGVDPARLVLLPGAAGDLPRMPGPPPREDGGFWRELHALLVRLYPSGPHDERVWERAGGNPSRLPSGASARSLWYDAVSLIRRGGGGVTAASLLREAMGDFPQDAGLRGLADQEPGP